VSNLIAERKPDGGGIADATAAPAEGAEQRRAQAEEALARYPKLSPAELEDLLDWYKREASALDVALLASNERIHKPYRKFRHDHIERFNWKEMAVGALVLTGALGFFGMLGLMAEAS
jgi:hypothetical protein